MQKQIVVIEREAMPVLREVVENGRVFQLGEHRDFRKHPALAEFLPDQARLSLAWTRLLPGETLMPHRHPTASMILVCEGEGRVIGDVQRTIRSGDSVLIPPGCLHGFEGAGERGFHALSVQFEERGLYEQPDKPLVAFEQGSELELLREYNRQRVEAHYRIPFFALLDDGTLADPERKQRFLACLRGWSSEFQRLLFNRQANTTDPAYASVFLQHLQEEFGHDQMIDLDQASLAWDPVLAATGKWFTVQMQSLDHLERLALVHWVLEEGAHAFHGKAARLLPGAGQNRKYFEAHSEADEGHSEMGMALFANKDAATYRRLKVVIQQGWDMLETMLGRMDSIIRA